jgi:predicted anti-sigma-YlaC factor YlaD
MQMIDDMACIELVDVVTDYLEEALPVGEVARIREHLASCDGCTAHVEQMRTAVRILQATPREQVAPETADALAGMFREWARGRSAR